MNESITNLSSFSYLLFKSFYTLLFSIASIALFLFTYIHFRYYKSLKKNNIPLDTFWDDIFHYSYSLCKFAFIFLTTSFKGIIFAIYGYAFFTLCLHLGIETVLESLYHILLIPIKLFNGDEYIINLFNLLISLSFIPVFTLFSWLIYNFFNAFLHSMSRESAPEYIDSGRDAIGYTLETYHENLKDMGYLNAHLGADYAALSIGYKKFLPKSISKPISMPIQKDRSSIEDGKFTTVLDVGCGGGWMSRLLIQTFENIYVTAVDTGKDAIDFAISTTNQLLKHNESLKNIKYILQNQPQLDYPEKSFDIVTCTLVCHHIHPESELISFFENAFRICRRGLVINDLERDIIPLFLFKSIVCSMFSNPLTQHDGYLSIRRAFTEEDWERILTKANIRQYAKIIWTPALRWIITIEKPATI